jgi:hypothetical protein
MDLSRAAMYRLPYSMTDNPHAWVEVTDQCNLVCRGCFREQMQGHRPLQELRDEIRLFREERNCDSISLAGGEPILHPDIVEIVRTISDLGMKSALLTNGIALEYDLLSRLRDAGLCKVQVHVDSFQSRPRYREKNELQLMEVRQAYLDLVDQVGGLGFNLLTTLSRETLRYVPAIVRWAADNIDKIAGIAFFTFSTLPLGDDIYYTANGEEVDASVLGYAEEDPEPRLTDRDVADAIAEADPDFQPAAYLNGTPDHRSNRWLIAVRVGRPGRVLGYLGPRLLELAQVTHHLVKGRYFFFTAVPRHPASFLALGLLDRAFRPALRHGLGDALRRPLRAPEPVYTQGIAILRPPEFVEGGIGVVCEGCPDVTVFDGRFVRSCRLDELRHFGSFVSMHRRSGSGPGDEA